MKLANFTFSRVGTWLIKSLPVLVFMILSLGVEAQVITPGEALAQQQGLNLVGDDLASERLKTQITQLEAVNPQTNEERADVTFRYKYAMYILNSMGEGAGYQYTLLNSMDYLQAMSDAAFNQSQIRIEPQEVYDEMVGLLRS